MNVILLENVSNLGDLGDQVNVKAGFGRNYLIPQGKAVPATPDNVAKFEERRAELEKAAAERLAAAEARKAAMGELVVTIPQKAGEEGKLFGSVGTTDIAHAISEAGFPVNKSEVRLPEGALRHVGSFEIDLEFHSGVVATVTIEIVPE